MAPEIEARFAAAADADEKSDRFELVTVIMAVVLFFLGMGSIVKRKVVRTNFIAIGGVFLVVSLVVLGLLTF